MSRTPLPRHPLRKIGGTLAAAILLGQLVAQDHGEDTAPHQSNSSGISSPEAGRGLALGQAASPLPFGGWWRWGTQGRLYPVRGADYDKIAGCAGRAGANLR
jgi:hypothetical protein